MSGMRVEKSFEHFLMTRFNVKYDVNSPAASDAWLRRRIQLFSEYTLPSIKAQSRRPDHWLVMCDTSSPTWFRRDLLTLAASTLIFKPVWVSAPFRQDTASAAVEAWRDASIPSVITTRLDNDDALSYDFIEMVQRQYRGQPFEFINLRRGAQFSGGFMYYVSDLSNPFISLIETPVGGSLRTVWLDEHGLVGRHGPVRQLNTHTAWLQIVHGGNVANSVHGAPMAGSQVAKHFPDGMIPRKHLGLGRRLLGGLRILRRELAYAFKDRQADLAG